MSRRLSCAQWILTAACAVILAFVSGLIFLVHSGQSMGPEAPVESGQFEAAPAAPPPLTAQHAYEQALPVARSWSADARLWLAEAGWPAGSNPQEPPAAWMLTFYSRAQQAAIRLHVAVDAVTRLDTQAVSSPPDLADVSNWRVDSPEAFDLVFANGGEAFFAIFPQRSLLMSLHAGPSLRWQATIINEGPLGNSAGRQVVILQLSAEDGRLITTPLEGDSGG